MILKIRVCSFRLKSNGQLLVIVNILTSKNQMLQILYHVYNHYYNDTVINSIKTQTYVATFNNSIAEN